MKKILSILLTAVMVLSITACGGNAAETSTVTEITEPVAAPLGEMRDISVDQLVAEMGAGWNLGNSLDAEQGETSWGNPETTQEMIDAVAAAGFNLIRIPTTWFRYTSQDGTYTIDSEWLERVKEVVDYAFRNNMYVIINMHHENSWRKPDYEHLESTLAQMKASWTQIAEYFKDYGDHLLFEGMNEPRIVGGTNEWNGGTEEGRDCINQMNQAFIDAVRATGGNNEKRALLITTFAASASSAAFDGFIFPEDKNLILSIHAYTPYKFTYDNPDESWNATAFDESVSNEIDYLANFIQNELLPHNIPVIITEYGAVTKSISDEENNLDDVVQWTTYFNTKMKELNVRCIWWDNNTHGNGNEHFGLFVRETLTWSNPSILEAIMNSSK